MDPNTLTSRAQAGPLEQPGFVKSFPLFHSTSSVLKMPAPTFFPLLVITNQSC